MAVHSESAAATGRVVTARFPYREVAAIVGVVVTATTGLIVGMQWAISNNLGPLFLTMQSIEAHVLSTRKEVNVLHGEFGEFRGEVGSLRIEVGGLRTEVGGLRTEVKGVSGEVGELRGEFRELRAEVKANRDQIAENRAEIAENRRQIVDLRERMTRVETGLEQVQANQVRMLEILEREPPPGG